MEHAQGCHLVLFRFFNTKNAPKYQNFYLATQMEYDQSSYFCRGPDDFCWGPAPVGPTLVTGPMGIWGMDVPQRYPGQSTGI